MNKLIYIPILFIAVALISCGNKQLLPKDYAAYVRNPENGYIKTANKSNIKIECFYKPVDYVLVITARKNNITTAEYNTLKKDLDGSIYYEILIYHDKAPDGNTQSYINYSLENDLLLVNKTDTLKPNSYLVEPYNGVQPYQRVLFSFNADKAPENYSVLIDSTSDKSLLKSKFLYSSNDIKEVALKLND